MADSNKIELAGQFANLLRSVFPVRIWGDDCFEEGAGGEDT